MFWESLERSLGVLLSHSLRYLDGVVPFIGILSALRTKPVKSRRILGAAAQYMCFLSLSALRCSLIPALTIPGSACVAPDTTALAVTGVVLTAAGVALAMWSAFGPRRELERGSQYHAKDTS